MLLEVGLLCQSMLIYLDGENQTYLCLIVYPVTQIDHLSNWVMHNEDNTKCVCYLITYCKFHFQLLGMTCDTIDHSYHTWYLCLTSLLMYDKNHNHIWFHLMLGLGLDLYLVTGSAKVHISIVVLIYDFYMMVQKLFDVVCFQI
jgi:hypothetical protein